MTKAEYLESIGYEHYSYSEYFQSIVYLRKIEPETHDYKKSFDNGIMTINIQLGDFMIEPDCIRSQKDIDNLQIAFNNVKRDFEEMQKYD